MSDIGSDFDDSDSQLNNFLAIKEEIEKCKSNTATAGMFVSGWDDADQNVEVVMNPKANPNDYALWAAENGKVETLVELLTSQPELVHIQDADGYSLLHRAAYGNHVDAISYLLGVGANVGLRTQFGWTPLHSACNWNNYSAAARLLAAGADTGALSDGAQTPLHLASAISHCKSTLLLLLLREDTVEIAHKVNNSGQTAEQLARGHGIYSPIFEMVCPAASYIRSLAFTCNSYVREKLSHKL